jgi:flagellum-specific ATP synthase
MSSRLSLVPEIAAVRGQETIVEYGRVTKVLGLVIEGVVPGARIGSFCDIYPEPGSPPVGAEVVGFRDRKVVLMPLGDLRGVRLGSEIRLRRLEATTGVGDGYLGRVVDGEGRPIDGGPPIPVDHRRPLYASPPSPLSRSLVERPLDLGIKALNGLLTCGEGQRVAIMAGSGVGKSTLLGMIARHTQADVNVIALIGERGREVRHFLARDLGPEGLQRSVVVAATSDQSPLLRMRGAHLATTLAEHFRDQGRRVLLMMDSVTRFAMAAREVGLAAGEPPTTKGYTPSVFAQLPRLLERAGTCAGEGSITGLYAVLVEGDDFNEPIADAVRSILDGHVVLSRRLAAANHYPSIEVLDSVSRVMGDVTSPEHRALAARMRDLLAAYRDAEDMIQLGAYVMGSNRRVDEAISRIDKIRAFLRQDVNERWDIPSTVAAMAEILGEVKS